MSIFIKWNVRIFIIIILPYWGSLLVNNLQVSKYWCLFYAMVQATYSFVQVIECKSYGYQMWILLNMFRNKIMQRRKSQFKKPLIWKEFLKKFRLAGMQTLTSAIPVQHSNQYQLASQLGPGHLTGSFLIMHLICPPPNPPPPPPPPSNFA